jgi:phosphoribosylformylglycinamidine synthase
MEAPTGASSPVSRELSLLKLDAHQYCGRMRIRVVVTPKAAVLDPQGAAVRDAMQHLGVPEVRSVRIGKYLEIELEGDNANLEARLHQVCHDLLSNPVTEDYQLHKD